MGLLQLLFLSSLMLLPFLSFADLIVNIDDFGVNGDISDATLAFEKSWSKACASTSPVTIVVPEGKKYLLKPIAFSGPCKSGVTFMINGTIEAPSDRSYWRKNNKYWISFDRVNNLHILGGGIIDGNGQIWWQNSCKINKSQPCKDAPTALLIRSSNNVIVESLTVRNSQQIHVEFEDCNTVNVHNVIISAPENSPNTDGIHIANTQNVVIDHCTIGTGDDCISIVSGSQNIKSTNIVCGPGHGISIGSLGDDDSAAEVSSVTVDTAELTGTSNGVRIKTWPGGRGYVKHIRFMNINMHDVENPIIIDQNYCDFGKSCPNQNSGVQVTDVHYQNIRGTSASDVAIELQCSKSVPCQGIVLQGINLVKNNGGVAESSCANVNLSKNGIVIPSACA